MSKRWEVVISVRVWRASICVLMEMVFGYLIETWTPSVSKDDPFYASGAQRWLTPRSGRDDTGPAIRTGLF
jgi:hypothetical protein